MKITLIIKRHQLQATSIIRHGTYCYLYVYVCVKDNRDNLTEVDRRHPDMVWSRRQISDDDRRQRHMENIRGYLVGSLLTTGLQGWRMYICISYGEQAGVQSWSSAGDTSTTLSLSVSVSHQNSAPLYSDIHMAGGSVSQASAVYRSPFIQVIKHLCAYS